MIFGQQALAALYSTNPQLYDGYSVNGYFI